MRIRPFAIVCALAVWGGGTVAAASALQSDSHAAFRFRGVIEERIKANEAQWLLTAPRANPALLHMFQLRNRKPPPQWVPWAGEFVGKYLISAIHGLQLSGQAELQRTVAGVVERLIESQGADGYLGPFPKEKQLVGEWDLWGHYHAILGLLMWHERTGDAAALRAARRAADLICATFLDGSLRVKDAGSPEMNMAILHGMARLYQVTKNPRYFELTRAIEQDWRDAGDYLRSGRDGVEFFQSPKPRWESLHSLQGLAELYQITGEAGYREALIHHWRSIVRWDRRNTGGFSGREQATGDAYEPSAIETCATVAWMELTLDVLRLTGDPLCADELELSFWNAACGAQHPSGRWWTYNTPMDGVREASAHAIVFQARAGSPELNCCSVNGPRALGSLAAWAVMRAGTGLALNLWAPLSFQGKLSDQTPVALEVSGDAPWGERFEVRVEPVVPKRFPVRFRIPKWASSATVRVGSDPPAQAVPGTYFVAERQWRAGDRVVLDFSAGFRAVPGANHAEGKVSVYYGPLLLAFDQEWNLPDEPQIPSIDLNKLRHAKMVQRRSAGADADPLRPWLVIETAASDGSTLQLSDFANAGARGTRYLTWLNPARTQPPPAVTFEPRDGAVIPSGARIFRWAGSRPRRGVVVEYALSISLASDGSRPLFVKPGIQDNRVLLSESDMARVPQDQDCYWRVTAINGAGETECREPLARFRIDSSLPRSAADAEALDKDRFALNVRLHGPDDLGLEGWEIPPQMKAAAGPDGRPNRAVEWNGGGLLRMPVARFPSDEYSVAVWVNIRERPQGRMGQVFSAWSGPLDDPLRLCVEGDKLYARVEAGAFYSTEGVTLPVHQWTHVAAVKSGGTLRLHVNGVLAGQTQVPPWIWSRSTEIALGGNPRFEGNERLAAQFSMFRFASRAFTAAEIERLAVK